MNVYTICSISEHTGYFHLLAIMSNAAMKLVCKYLLPQFLKHKIGNCLYGVGGLSLELRETRGP